MTLPSASTAGIPAPGVRAAVVPKAVRGPMRRAKWAVLAVLLAIYWTAPWLRWDRGPHAPDQAFLIDLAHRKAYFLFFEIWPQEVYVVAGILMMMAVGLFLLTALFGRVWCGYACPQTVWTDLFLAVERWVEGDRAERLRRQAGPWTPGRVARHAAKHTIWIAVAALTGGAWVLYFGNAPTVARDVVTGQAGFAVYATILLLTATTYLLAGWARETVCTFMCPYARFQSAMFDRDTLMVQYRGWRGEPRGKRKPGATVAGQGDCIDCRQCVEVCPTGVDIRNGPQIDCINCGLCIDACDAIMVRMGSPVRLIAHDTERNLEASARGGRAARRYLRPRTVLYAVLYVALGAVLLAALLGRSTLDVNVLPDRNPLYVTLSSGALRNGYTLKLLNKALEPRTVTIGLAGIDGRLDLVGADEPDGRAVTMKPDTVTSVRAFVTVEPVDWSGASHPFDFVIVTDGADASVVAPTHFEGPAP